MAENNFQPTATSRGGHINHSNQQSIAENYLVIWLDANVTTSSEDSQNTVQQLRSVVNDINLFTEPDNCADFLTDIHNEKVFLIVSGSLGEDLVPCIHSMIQIGAIYILCDDKSRHEQWVKKWSKVKGVYTRITGICQALELAVKQCNQDLTAISFPQVNTEGASDTNLNQLEPSFMYTQLFKKTPLNMEHNREKVVPDLVKYCEEKYVENSTQLNLINEFRRDYRSDKAIWWYTRECFIYQMLNRALRLLEADIIVNMGFFIHDLHRQIQQPHNEQVAQYCGTPFVVYRGQGLSITDFEKLSKSRDKLMSFNSFLSTSKKKEASMVFANRAVMGEDRIGILFIMSIEPTITSTPFADIQRVSHFRGEGEILFSMHTVFRIRTIQPMDGTGRLFQVNLTLTDDDDTKLRTLTDQFDADVQLVDGWERMGRLLIKAGQPNKAEALYFTLLEQTSNPQDQSRYYDGLGCINREQGDYRRALRYYERAIEMQEKSLHADHPSLATCYNHIGEVYKDMGEYSKALSNHERALEMKQKSLPVNDPSFAVSYSNIGLVYDKMGVYPKALSNCEQALEMLQKSLPANHPDLASSYNNIGGMYRNMGECSKALSYYERALEIQQESLSGNHPSLATSYNNIGLAYHNVGEYSKALSNYEQALEIFQKSLPENHPRLHGVRESVRVLKVKLNIKVNELSLE